MAAYCVLFVLATVAVASAFPNGSEPIVTFAPFLLSPTAKIPSSFLSFNFDWNLNRTAVDAWSNASVGFTLNLQDPKLIALAKALAPANLRVGGSNADVAMYNEEFPGGSQCSAEARDKKVCLSPSRWDEIVEFANKTGLRLVFDLNIMYGRDTDGKWNSSQVRALLAYTAKRHSAFPHGFELGNEKEFAIAAPDAARCFATVRAIIDEFWPSPTGRPILVGPAQNPRPDWLSKFLDALPANTLDAVTYHMYPGFGRSRNLTSLILRPAWLDFSHTVMLQMQRALNGRATQLWIGETAAAWASGTAGVCDGYISGFWWLDQLAHAASTGHSAMCRQCLVGGNYSLLDQLHGLAPNPDYWSAWLWRQLVGRTFLAVSQVMPYMGDFVPDTRGYMACTPEGAPGYEPGAVTFVYINQSPSNKSIHMYQRARVSFVDPHPDPHPDLHSERWGPVPPPFPNLPRLEFVLTPGKGSMLSRDIALNGEVLRLASGSLSLPPLVGRAGAGEMFRVPARSYGMCVYPKAAAPACMK